MKKIVFLSLFALCLPWMVSAQSIDDDLYYTPSKNKEEKKEEVQEKRQMLEKEYHRYPALIPESPFMDDKAPGKVKKVKMVWTYEGPVLFWTAPKAKDEMDKAVQYVVYRFDKKEKVNLDDASHIVAITRDHFYPLPYNDGKTKYQYVVTALDRLHNESKGTKKKVKL